MLDMIELDANNFEQEVLSAPGPVFVEFWGHNCPLCKELLPKIEAWAEGNSGRAKFCKMDTAANLRLAILQQVMGLPYLAFYQDGEKVASYDKHSIDLAELQRRLDELTR